MTCLLENGQQLLAHISLLSNERDDIISHKNFNEKFNFQICADVLSCFIDWSEKN